MNLETGVTPECRRCIFSPGQLPRHHLLTQQPCPPSFFLPPLKDIFGPLRDACLADFRLGLGRGVGLLPGRLDLCSSRPLRGGAVATPLGVCSALQPFATSSACWEPGGPGARDGLGQHCPLGTGAGAKNNGAVSVTAGGESRGPGDWPPAGRLSERGPPQPHRAAAGPVLQRRKPRPRSHRLAP